MTASGEFPATTPIGSRVEAEGYVAMICFKHGPPLLHGVELEWTVHHADDPHRPLDAGQLSKALGAHAPATLVQDSPQLPLGRGSLVTVEPGGQVEISGAASASIPRLIDDTRADAAELTALLAAQHLRPGAHGLDAFRPPHRILTVPRYAAMHRALTQLGSHGPRMMCSTAGLQVCLDAGEADRTALRWRALHDLGPALVALFANSRHREGADTGWASARTEATFGTCAPFTEPPSLDGDPAEAWARTAMEAPVLCLRRGESWDAPPGLTFGAWADGALDGTGLAAATGEAPGERGFLADRPTYGDLEYHLSTLFPPVRPRGYLEVRYLDAQEGDGWIAPTLLLSTLMSDPAITDQALAAAAPAAGRWIPAAREGLDDKPTLQAARELVQLAATHLSRTGVDQDLITTVSDQLHCIVDDTQRRRAS
ncbi:glutamate-cysteine ligase family protein [Kribbella sp. CA-293567]|uniref:glutamate-cysteine ligase family protein n=1 Tax=Kribbella sp. CA-293567 TaxID=3002436 RepID=UPI0022DD5E72|nr:glutamate-cysteine ligase family protein [Kribbella sp. CA-293567]WBQ07255.1 glutamate-cysteine ligase family protein [Kribbella sp. CA-293567]